MAAIDGLTSGMLDLMATSLRYKAMAAAARATQDQPGAQRILLNGLTEAGRDAENAARNIVSAGFAAGNTVDIRV